MASFGNSLTPLQRALLELLKDAPGGYLSGGAALSGYLDHRRSLDIDVFVSEADGVEMTGLLLESGAGERGWQVRQLRMFPGFRRYVVRDGVESTLVDIVHENVLQIVPLKEKPIRDGVRVDSIEDLVATKLCAVLGRSEVKDLVDLYFLAESGIDVADHVREAHTKDGGMEPATLAFVLQQMPTVPEGLLLLRPIEARHSQHSETGWWPVFSNRRGRGISLPGPSLQSTTGSPFQGPAGEPEDASRVAAYG